MGEIVPEEGKGSDFTVDPAHPLPIGLQLDTLTGKITGAPASVSARADYNISFDHDGENLTQALSIAVTSVADVRLGGTWAALCWPMARWPAGDI